MINISKVRQIIEKEDEGPTLDYKEDLNLETDGNKAQFVKDVLSLANSGELAHMIIGVENGTRKLVGIKTSHKAEQLNDILKGKCDPPLSIEYVERTILGHKVGVVEFLGENPPYIVAVPDKFGGVLSSDSQNRFYIERGTVFVRKYNKNEGASRADLDKMYKVKYVTLQSDLRISHEVLAKPVDDETEVKIKFALTNHGNVLATQPYVYIKFKNVKEIVKCDSGWTDESSLNNNIPTVSNSKSIPVCPTVTSVVDGVTVRMSKGINQIEADMVLGAGNMRFKEGKYIIPFQTKNLQADRQ